MSKRSAILIAVLSVIFLSQRSNAETITVSNTAAQAGDTVQVIVSLDNPVNTLGAVFTVNYDTEYLTLNQVVSPFFQSFAQQWSGSQSAPNPLPPSQVTVDGETYDQPLVWNMVEGGVMLAAVNIDSGKVENSLFVLEFSLSPDIADGIYPISISTSYITSSDAGYPEEGVGLPLLFPSKTTAAVSGRVSVNTSITDSDGDGIDDVWEIQNFGNLNSATSLSDYDDDGYSDLQEYLNQLSGTLDSNGAQFNPKVKNSSGSVGYVLSRVNSNILKIIIPVILENARKLQN